MKVVIPVAGKGSRLAPHTHTTSKALMEVAGKPILEYVMKDVMKLKPSEVIFVVGYMKESIVEFIEKKFPDLNCSFVEQKVRDGDGSAIRLGLDLVETEEDLYVIFGADTLIDFDIRKGINKFKQSDAVVFAMEVEEPSSYGVLNVDESFEVYEIEEKPKVPKSNLAVIGAYYFKSALRVKKILNECYENKIKVKGEYKLMQVLDNYVADSDRSVKAVKVNKWFDCGRVEVLLKANEYLLSKLKLSGEVVLKGNSIIISPCYISSEAKLDRCVVGPNVSISSGASLKNVNVRESIIGARSVVENQVLCGSLVGKDVFLKTREKQINVGDKTEFLDLI